MRIQTTRKLYQTHANVLSPLGYSSPVDIARQPFSTFRQTCREQLSFSETRTLYRAARQHVQHLQAYRRKIISHTNPQLQNTPHLAIDSMSVESSDYETQFGQRADAYVTNNSVASMFSPAAYLTELYREGSQLHQKDKPQHLDNRRPDLQGLPLNQSNLDAPVSTLALSNEILRTSLNQTDLDQQLASQLYPFDLPYHAPFYSIEAALAAQHSSVITIFRQLESAMETSDDPISVIAFTNQLSPTLAEALLEPVPSNAGELDSQLQQHFGSDITAAKLADVDKFCTHTGISRNELNAWLSLPGLTQSLNNVAAGYTTEAIAIAPDDAGAQYLNSAKGTNAENFVAIAGNTLVIDTATLSQSSGGLSECYVLPCTDPDQLRFRYKYTASSDATGADTLTITVNGVTCETRMVNNSYAHWLEFSLALQGQKSGLINIAHNAASSTLSYTQSNIPITAACLLRLSRLIRYGQKTGLSSATLDRLITLSKDDDKTPPINPVTPVFTGQALEYMARYTVDEDDAVVLAGGEINVYAPEGQLSQFDKLFNNPLLHGQAFTTDDDSGTISFDPDDTTYAAQRAVLKRAFGVDDAGLGVLATLCDGDSQSWARSLARMSDLYRVALWATVHELSPQALQCVLALNGITSNLAGQSTTLLAESLQAVYATCQWLLAQSLSVNALYAMTTKDYPTTLTPEMDALLRTLHQSANDETPQSLKNSFAPHLAAALGLSGSDQALLLEDWIDQIAGEQGLALTSISEFWNAIIKFYDYDSESISVDLAAFCQALGQLTLITKTWQLSTVELALLVHKPQMLQDSQKKLSLTLSNLQSIAGFKALQQAAGEHVSELLTALDNNALSIALLAQLLEQPVDELTLAATAMGLGTTASINITQASHITLWLQTAQDLGISVSVVDTLLTQALDASYASWQTLAGNIQAGVPTQSALTVNSNLDEALSTALCAYYFTSAQAGQVITNGIPLQNRDDLFQYLLIDNQVSADINTSRLAEAISSVQLYIHRCLQGMEANVDRNQELEAFFVEWDQYNKRYSTWAGVSQLTYYPENYIDPTLRYNQTSLQQELLNEVSQSQLSSDAVETAYLNYLNGFEDIANLNVLCGYHHAADMDKGISYFVGRTNAEPYQYFWRSLNHEAIDGLGGYVASAWTDWEEINAPINPVRGQVRPVIFNNRLYIGWVELRSRPQTSDDGEVTGSIDEYLLQLSYRKINSSWNPAMSFALTIPASLIPASEPIFDVYISYHPLQNAILAMLYDPSGQDDGRDYDSTGNLGAWAGGFIDSRMQYNPIVDGEDADTDPDDEALAVFSLFYKNLNGPSAPNKVIRRINAVNFSTTTTTPGPVIDTTDSTWLILSNVDIVDEEVDNLSVPPVLSYTAQATIQTKNPTGPTEINIPHTAQDNSGSNFNVLKDELTIDLDISNFIYTLDVAAITMSSLIASFAGETKPLIYDSKTGYVHQLFSFNEAISPEGKSTDETLVIFSVDEQHYWQRDYTLGYTATSLPPVFTYNWGEEEVSLPTNDTTSVAKEYAFLIPTNGLSQTRTLTVEQDGVVVFKQNFLIVTSQNEAAEPNPEDYFQIIEDDNQALYLEASNQPRRTRLNTLFASELIQRASSGLDNVLNWDTQQLPEPQTGPGTYVNLTLKPYDSTIDDGNRQLTIKRVNVFENGDSFPLYEGALSDETQTVTVFLPYFENVSDDEDSLYIARVFQNGQQNTIRFTRADTTDPHGWALDDNHNGGTFPGLHSAEALKNDSEPMDFSGANGLYFWELFYYTPMLVNEKLLQVQNFEEAEKWLEYVFNPQGYVEGSYPTAHHVDRQWNVRPLEEDTAWDDTQTDSTDPDIIAQADPMHYKVATYMKLLDLLIARGDMAYRLLERDTLAEAKMWYVTALNLLGTEPDLPLTGQWSNPTLSTAASTTLQTQSLQVLEQLSDGSAPAVQAGEPQILTANSLTALFLPSENDKLKGYWQTLNQRLFNLRHNLSLNGQPLTLPLYASPADPKALQSAAAAASASGGASLPANITIAIQRFPVMLDSARYLVAQLVQYGSTLASVLERKDAEALNTLMQTQAQDLMQRNIQSQDKVIEQLQAEQKTLQANLAGSTARLNSYQALLDEGVSRTEQQAIDERIASGSMATAANAVRIAGAGLDTVPNVYGLAVGGSRWGAVLRATASGMDASATGLSTSADSRTTSEQYRRRAQEWTIQRDAAEHEIEQNEAQQASLAIQLEAARLQKQYLEVQREQGQVQLEFLKTKFSNEALYNWMQGKLSALFYQLYDLAVSRCMKAQLGYQWETKDTATFVQPGAWDSNHAGLLCGEALTLNLAQMETAYQDWDGSALEVSRTVSMAQAMEQDLTGSSFNAEVNGVLTSGTSFGSTHTLSIATDNTSLVATINLSPLKIKADYPDSVVGTDKIRRIKQVSVSLPALLGPYQDIQALLAYSGSGGGIHQSCTSTAISHGINDSGQFQLNFNDDKYLPFEGLPIDGGGSAGLTLTFPNAIGTGTDKQNTVLQTLSDIILHLNYTIRS